jgi:dTDP-4-dehydrorhamnose 3,5-epimerase
MKITETPIPGLLIIEPDVISDLRGYFFESWQDERYRSAGIEVRFIQDNESKSVQGVVRGLHYQLEPWSQAKLVRVVEGRVYDVAVDLRKTPLHLVNGSALSLMAPLKTSCSFPEALRMDSLY